MPIYEDTLCKACEALFKALLGSLKDIVGVARGCLMSRPRGWRFSFRRGIS